jgi:HEPN domain-containing protein
MPHDPARVEETKGWFAKAAEDLRAAAFELTASPPLTSDIAFHAQQAVEKSLKGFLAWHDRPFRKTHNLVELGGECVALDAGLDPLLRRAAPLTEYATRFRYPGGGSPSAVEAAQALDIAREVFDAVLRLIPPEVQPTRS